jgi:hypothetical protein
LTISPVKWPIVIHSNVVEIIKNPLGKQEGISVHASTCSLFELLGNWVSLSLRPFYAIISLCYFLPIRWCYF